MRYVVVLAFLAAACGPDPNAHLPANLFPASGGSGGAGTGGTGEGGTTVTSVGDGGNGGAIPPAKGGAAGSNPLTGGAGGSHPATGGTTGSNPFAGGASGSTSPPSGGAGGKPPIPSGGTAGAGLGGALGGSTGAGGSGTGGSGTGGSGAGGSGTGGSGIGGSTIIIIGTGGSGTGGTTSVPSQGGTGGTSTPSSGVLASYTFPAGTEPCTPAKDISGGQSGNFGTKGAFCFRTADDFSDYGCSSVDGRTLKINGTTIATCGGKPPAKLGSFYYFDFGPGTYEYASVNWYCSNQSCQGPLGTHPVPSCGHYPAWQSGATVPPCADSAPATGIDAGN